MKPLTGEALRACIEHEWKGNVRELKSAVEQAVLLAPGTEITPADLFGGAAETGTLLETADRGSLAADGATSVDWNASAADDGTAVADSASSFRIAKERVVAAFDRDFLLRALRRNGGNITKAADEIGMYRQNLQQKMRELGITVDDAATEPDRDNH